MNQIKLSQLTYEHLKKCVWAIIPESMEEEDFTLTPATLTPHNLISMENGEVWCLCKAVFSNGAEQIAAAMCRGDDDDSPRLFTFWNGTEDVGLMLPPAPDFVLEKRGPKPFSQKFGLHVSDVFPIVFEVIQEFEIEPRKRKVLIQQSGVVKIWGEQPW